MTCLDTIDFDLTVLLGEESGTPLMGSPSPIVSFGSFGWSDFPIAVVGQQQSEASFDDFPSLIDTTEVSQDTNSMHIAPSPVVSFDSFGWSQFPVAVTSSCGSEFSTREKVGAKASDKANLAGYGFGAVTAF